MKPAKKCDHDWRILKHKRNERVCLKCNMHYSVAYTVDLQAGLSGIKWWDDKDETEGNKPK